MLRKFTAIVVVGLMLSISVPVTAGPGGPEAPGAATVLGTPLPLNCPGIPAPSACLYGYVYYNQVPVSGASVKVESIFGELLVTTTVGLASAYPYFQANLSEPPLLVQVAETITLTANYNGKAAVLTYVAVAGGQQADPVIRSSVLFGDGSDGPLTISSNITESPIDSAAAGTAGTTTLFATNPNFIAGQLILIHQSQGQGAGTWMSNRIESYTADIITLRDALNATYTNGAQVRVIRQYTNVTIDGGTTYSAKAWDGTVGGILAFVANGTVSIAGTLSAIASGYRGGPAVDASNPRTGFQGEGAPGIGTTPASNSNDTFWTTANGNGGGGGFNDSSALSGVAGGGGGNGTAGAPGDLADGGVVGAGGSTYGTPDLTTMVFGGGGGGGRNDGDGAGSGGAGGGNILISGNTIAINGSVVSSGSAGGNNHEKATGGGGAGGSILIRARSVALGTNLVTAAGGIGGSSEVESPDARNVGGNGRIHLDYYNSYGGATSPSASIQQLDCATSPIPTINAIQPYVAQQPQGTLAFSGQAASPDLCGSTITAYVWRTDVEGVLSVQSSFTRTATSLHIGTYPVFFRARDSHNIWSEEISRTITIQPDAPTAVNTLRLPLLLQINGAGFAGTTEIEPNNALSQANGPLTSGVDYHGYQNDTSDYFSFNSAGGSVSVNLSNISATGTQLQLYYQSTSSLVGYAGAAPYHIAYNGAAGWYYVRVVAGGGFNSVNPYTLRVTYP